MPVTRTCTFCGNEIEPGTGKMYVRRDGTVHYFCSSKCQKNQLKLGRIGRTVRWTRRYVRTVRERAPRAAPEEAAPEEEAPEEVVPEVAAEVPPAEMEAPEAEVPEEEVPVEAVAEEAPPDRDAVLNAFGQIPGVGPAMAEALWNAGFTSVKALGSADEKALTEVRGIGPATAQKILDHLKGGA